MPLTHRDSPENGLEVLKQGVSEALQGGGIFASTFAPAAGAPEVLAPHPVYTVAGRDIAEGRLLDAARLIAWRYLIMQNDEPVAVGILAEEEGRLHFSGLNQGRLVERSVEGIAAVVTADAFHEKDYELRYLEIRPLYFAALWLHADDDDMLIPLEDHEHCNIEAHAPYDEATILEMLQAHMEFHNPLPGQGLKRQPE